MKILFKRLACNSYSKDWNVISIRKIGMFNISKISYDFVSLCTFFLFFIWILLVISACSVGYFGPNCSLPCRYPNYGLGCQLKCNCEREHCNHITGCQNSSITSSTKISIYTLHMNKHACLFFPKLVVYLYFNSFVIFLQNYFRVFLYCIKKKKSSIE